MEEHFRTLKLPSLDTLSRGDILFDNIVFSEILSKNKKSIIAVCKLPSEKKIIVKQTSITSEPKLYIFEKECYCQDKVSRTCDKSPAIIDSFICASANLKVEDDIVRRYLNEFNRTHIIDILKQNRNMDLLYGIIVMDYVKGISLSCFIDNPSLFPKLSVKVLYQNMIELCNMLNTIGILHSDIHSDNLLVDENSNIHLIDYEYSGDFAKYNPMIGAHTFSVISNKIKTLQRAKAKHAKIIFWFDYNYYSPQQSKKIIEFVNLSQLLFVFNIVMEKLNDLIDSETRNNFLSLWHSMTCKGMDKVLCIF